MSTLPGASGVLDDIRVLLTRAGRDATTLRVLLETRGAEVLELPAIAITPPDDLEPLDRALKVLHHYDWIVFSSRHAVSAVFSRLAALGLPGKLSPSVAAVGTATAAALTERGVRVDIVPVEAGARPLLAALQERNLAGQRVLLPASDLARHELPQGLREQGAEVEVVVAYRTIQPVHARSEVLQALRRGGIDVVVFASPSAVRNLAAMLGAQVTVLAYVKIVCIGPTTAAAVRELSLAPVAVATEQSDAGMVEAIIECCSRKE